MSEKDLIVTFPDYGRIDPKIAADLMPVPLLPFEVHPDFGGPYASVIDPGPVPPTYVHSWAFAMSGFTTFKLSPARDGLELNWLSGDHVVFYVPETGQRKVFTSEVELRASVVELSPLPAAFPVRAYLILKASTERWADPSERRQRRFRIEGVRPLASADDPKVVLVGDDLNYDTRLAPNHDPWYSDGTPENVSQGWIQGQNTWAGVEVGEPREEDGWYLLARFTPPPQEAADMALNALVYYNEQTSHLRLYVLPGPRLDGATGLDVRLRLLGRDPGSKSGYVPLKGAFFDDDSSPHTWSEAHLPITRLATNRWTMAQTSVLFPMATDLPAGQDTSGPGLTTDEGRILTDDPRFPPRSEWLKPIYDSQFESQNGNIRLQVEITPFERGSADLDFIGEGVGAAIQDSTPSGDPFLKILKDSIGSAIETGKGANKAADWIYQKVKASYHAHKPASTPPNAPLPGLLALSAGGFTGSVTAVAAAIAFFAKAFSEPEALRLALELKIRGTITGTIYTPLTKVIFDCYLPGRFDAEEMHISEGVSLQDPTLHQLTPRYDRPLGHLGYRYDPSRLKCRAIYFETFGDSDPRTDITFGEWAWNWSMRCVWPANKSPKYPYSAYSGRTPWRWGPDSRHHEAPIDGFLPVVFNEYAEIMPIQPIGTRRVEGPDPSAVPGGRESTSGIQTTQRAQLPDAPEIPHQPTHHHVGNVAFAAHLDPEPGDTTFPTVDIELGSIGSRSVWVFHDSDWLHGAAWDGTVEEFIEQQGRTFVERADGYWLDAGPGVWVPPLRDFLHPMDVRTYTFGQMSMLLYDEDQENPGSTVDSMSFLNTTLDKKHFRPYAPGGSWPLANIMFGWDVRYLYYGRSRQLPSGRVPRRRVTRPMRSPVTISVIRFECDFGMQESWEKAGSDAPSVMMLDSPW